MTEKVIRLLRDVRPYERIDIDTELIKSGILDSLAILSYIAQLEDEYNIIIPDEEVIASNFSSVNIIVKLIEKCIKEE